MEIINENLTIILDDLDKEVADGKIAEEDRGKVYMGRAAYFIAHLSLDYPDDFEGISEENMKGSNFIHSTIYAEHQDAFVKYYTPLIGRKIQIEGDKRIWVLIQFHFVLAPSRDGKERRKVYCHFRTEKAGHEKEILCFQIFRSLGIPLQLNVPWL
ncbi:hypothetical protein [Pedobacter terrae]|uniref:hypothetical protein n=1 Tax=Pedobacter terrae TaxID=405671 RepID=UPI002FFC5416